MATKKENKTIPITLTPFHQGKLKILCERTGLSKTQIVQRYIESVKIFKDEEEQLDKE